MSNQINVALCAWETNTFPNVWIVVSMLSDGHEGWIRARWTAYNVHEHSPFCRVAALDSLPTPVWKFTPNDGTFPDAKHRQTISDISNTNIMRTGTRTFHNQAFYFSFFVMRFWNDIFFVFNIFMLLNAVCITIVQINLPCLVIFSLPNTSNDLS